jgi:transmembrane sensor
MEYKVNEHMQEILIKCICSKADESDYKEAYDWIHLNDENKIYFDSLYSSWFAAGLTQNIDPIIEKRIWEGLDPQKQKVFNSSYKSSKKPWTNSLLKIAAMMAIAFSLGIFSHAYLGRNIKSSELYTVEAPKGAKSRITMADGTHVWLNAGSKIQYSAYYNQRVRDIYLTGEAYFEVAKNKSKPFRVHAGGIVVNALGTIFNVKAYPEEKVVETTLVEGLVSIEKTGSNIDKAPFLLKPTQHAVYFKTQAEIKITDAISDVPEVAYNNHQLLPIQPGKIVLTPKVETEVYTSWKDKRWVFHSETFGDFSLKLERIYDIHILIEDPQLKEYKLTGSIEEENIEMVIKALQLIIPIDYRFEHKQLIISIDNKLKYKFDQLLKKSNN